MVDHLAAGLVAWLVPEPGDLRGTNRPAQRSIMPMSERVLVEISVPPPASFPRRERRRGGRSAKPLVLYFEPPCDTIPPLTAAPIRRRRSALGLVPGQDHAAGKRPGLHQGQV